MLFAQHVMVMLGLLNLEPVMVQSIEGIRGKLG
jgi:hypothetical protein